jgi:hypothetical protein
MAFINAYIRVPEGERQGLPFVLEWWEIEFL